MSAGRRPWFVARSRGGILFQLWMVAFLAATASIVTGALALEGRWLGLPAAMAAVYLLEGLTVVVLALTYRLHWAPRARAADERLRDGALETTE